VWLRSGSFLAADVLSGDSSSTRISFAGSSTLNVLNNRIARLILRTSRRPIRFEVAENRTGLFLNTGDFLESDVEELSAKTVVMSSVLFGRRSYSRENATATALVLNEVGRSTAAVEVALKDGSVLRARKIRSDGSAIVIDELSLGEVRVPSGQLLEVRNGAASQRSPSS
jgi:hypothetical protein